MWPVDWGLFLFVCILRLSVQVAATGLLANRFTGQLPSKARPRINVFTGGVVAAPTRATRERSGATQCPRDRRSDTLSSNPG
jgi:hypothetical protein